MDLFSLAGKVALVTGGNTGLGRAVALGLQAAGAAVAVSGRDGERNARVAAALGPGASVHSLDIRDEASVTSVIAAVADRHGRLDILVNNVGYAQVRRFTETSLAEWNEMLAVNLTGAFLCARRAAQEMVARGAGGKIINVSSLYASFGPPNFAGYAAAKAGLLGFTRALAVELAPSGIQVNAIAPGWFDTERTKRVQAGALGEQIRRRTPAGRWGRPEDLVGPAVFLASAASDFVTGICLPVDGGYAVSERFQHE